VDVSPTATSRPRTRRSLLSGRALISEATEEVVEHRQIVGVVWVAWWVSLCDHQHGRGSGEDRPLVRIGGEVIRDYHRAHPRRLVLVHLGAGSRARSFGVCRRRAARWWVDVRDAEVRLHRAHDLDPSMARVARLGCHLAGSTTPRLRSPRWWCRSDLFGAAHHASTISASVLLSDRMVSRSRVLLLGRGLEQAADRLRGLIGWVSSSRPRKRVVEARRRFRSAGAIVAELSKPLRTS